MTPNVKDYTTEELGRLTTLTIGTARPGEFLKRRPDAGRDGSYVNRSGGAAVMEFTREQLIALARGLGEPWGDAIAAMLEADKRAMREAWNAWGHLLLVGDPEDNCGECGTLSEANYAATCLIHGPAGGALWLAMRQLAERIDACQCGHRVDEHESEDSTHCRVDGCSCRVMKLRGEA